MFDNLPPGYTGRDSPPTPVRLECPRGHVWATVEYHEYGCVDYRERECPHDGLDGEWTEREVSDVTLSAQCDECLEWDAVEDMRDGLCWKCRQKHDVVDFTDMATIARLLGVRV